MADLSDVEEAIKSLVSAALYPSGTGQPSAIGAPARVYRGWPNARALDADIAAGTINVTVFPEQGGRNTTRFPKVANDGVVVTPTLTVTTSEPTVTFGGAIGVTQLAGIRTNAGAWAVAVGATETPAAVATALGALIPGASVNGAAVTVSPSTGILGRVAGYGSALTEVRRQVQCVRVSFWCHSPAIRDTAAGLVDAVLGNTDWLTLADGTGGRMIYRGTFTNDAPTKDALWRRDFRYDVEYPTTISQSAAAMLFGGGVLLAGQNAQALTAYGDVQPSDGNVETDQSGNVWIDGAGNLLGEPPP